MSTYTKLIFHIVFSTHNRKPTLRKSERSLLFSYITGILKNKNCHLYQINGIEDHIHILTHIHPTIPLASLVKDIKLATISLIKEEGIFPCFDGWQDGYGGFSVSEKEKSGLIQYIENQEEHHQEIDFLDEYKGILIENGIEFDPKYLL